MPDDYKEAVNRIKNARRGSVSMLRETGIFCRQLAMVTGSDVTLLEGVSMIAAQTESREIRRALETVRTDMESGVAFYAAMSRHVDVFPAYMLAMIKIGEESGTLEEVLLRLADYYDKDAKVRRKVRSAATYPALLTILMLGVIVLLLVQVLPMFAQMLSPVSAQAALPGITLFMMDAGDFFASNYLIIIAAVLVLIALFFALRGAYGFDRLKFSLPFFRPVIVRITGARFASSVSLMLRSGLPVSIALEHAEPLMENVYVLRRFRELRRAVEEGKALATALEEAGVFPKLLVRMCAVGEKTGRLDVLLDKSASLFAEEVDGALDKLITSIEPVLIIILSVIVGAILLSVMLPIAEVLNSIT